MRLSEIADLQSGLVLTRKKASSEKDTVKIYQQLNIRSLNGHGTVDHTQLEDFSSKTILDSAVLTRTNDIVLKLFAPLNPTLIQPEDEGYVIPSQLAVIRVTDKTVLPGYLCYWLSTQEALDTIFFYEGWQSQRSIKIATLAALDIPIPSLEKQNLISDIISLQRKRQMLYQILIEEENKFTALKIQQAIGGKE